RTTGARPGRPAARTASARGAVACPRPAGPSTAGSPRPGSARNRATARRRRLAVGAGAVALVAAIGVGTWLATGGDEDGTGPQDTRNSAPAAP
ncbi:serine/threonine protein kinase, partial [Streptomyces sp. NPDC044989]